MLHFLRIYVFDIPCTYIKLSYYIFIITYACKIYISITIKTRLILELKSHKTPEQETRAVESIVKMVKDMGLENRMEYIAFSRHATKEFIRLTPKGTPVYYLEGDLSPKELKEWGCAGPDYHFSVFKRHPEWIKESHDLGMKVNAWTINDAKDMKWLIDHGVDFITTNVPVELQEILQ